MDSLLKRNEILLKYDKEKAEQLFLAEKQLYWSLCAGVLATGIFAVCLMMR